MLSLTKHVLALNEWSTCIIEHASTVYRNLVITLRDKLLCVLCSMCYIFARGQLLACGKRELKINCNDPWNNTSISRCLEHCMHNFGMCNCTRLIVFINFYWNCYIWPEVGAEIFQKCDRRIPVDVGVLWGERNLLSKWLFDWRLTLAPRLQTMIGDYNEAVC